MIRCADVVRRFVLAVGRRGKHLFILLATALAGTLLEAHPMPSSLIHLSVLETSITAEAIIPFAELENAVGEPAYGDINSIFLHQYFVQHIVAITDASAWHTDVIAIELTTDTDPMIGHYQEVVVHFSMTPQNADDLRRFTFRYDAIIHQVVTHRAMVFVQYDWRNGIDDESASQPIGVIGVDVPSGKIFPLEVDLGAGSIWKGFVGMFVYGMRHIREGLDHVLFLLTLLLIAPLAPKEKQWSGYQGLRYTVTRFMNISLAFTVGHSITLVAGSFGVLPFQAQFIEVIIAASIVVCAAHCIAPLFFRREVLLAGGFGLVHGLAFSTSLSALDAGIGTRLISLLGFNLGIEAMQLIIMVCFFPILLSSRWRFYAVLRTGFAVVTIFISVAWILERVLGHENFVTAYVNTLL